jgi:hypothetical protein
MQIQRCKLQKLYVYLEKNIFSLVFKLNEIYVKNFNV